MDSHDTAVRVLLLISFSVSSSGRFIRLNQKDCTRNTSDLIMSQYESKIEYLPDRRLTLSLYRMQCCLETSQSLPSCLKRKIIGVRKICHYESTETPDVLSYLNCTSPYHIPAPWIETDNVKQLAIKIEVSTIQYSRNTDVYYPWTLYIAICDKLDKCVFAVRTDSIGDFIRMYTFEMFTWKNVTNIHHIVIVAYSLIKSMNNHPNFVLFQIGMLSITTSDDVEIYMCSSVCEVTDTPLVITKMQTKVNYCNKIRSEKNPKLAYNKTLIGNSSDINCYRGSLTRECRSSGFRGLEAIWGEERNNSCLSADDVRKETSSTSKKQWQANYCNKTRSEKHPDRVYNKTSIGDSSEIKCYSGTLIRECQTMGGKVDWGIEKNNNCLSEVDVLKKFGYNTKKEMTSKNMEYFVESLADIIEVAKSNRTIAVHMLSTVGSFMAMDSKTLKQVDERGLKSDQMKRAIETLSSAMEIPNNHNSIVVSTPDINVGVYKINKIHKPITIRINFKTDNNTTTRYTGPRVIITNYLLRKWAEERNARFQIIAYRNSKLFIDARSDDKLRDQSVVSIIADKIATFATQETVFTYEIPVRDNQSKSISCVYWNNVERHWSTSGISLITGDNNEKICRSSHLSSFSILLDPDANERLPEKHEQYLTYISYIGCALSIVALVITIIIYSLFKSLRGDDSGKILINICVSMLMLNLVFIIGSLDSESYDIGICMAVGVAMHYFLLTSLLWMMIEALNMYDMLIVVFRHRHRWFMKIRMLAGWGMPLAVVGITLSISTNSYKPSNQFCFLSQTNKEVFYVAVLAPSCIMLLVNSYIFIRILILIIKSKKCLRESSSTISITQVRGAMSVMFILGITWVLGPLAIGPAKVIFAYLFTILNSSQGVLLFIFRCVFNIEAARAMKLYTTTGRFKERRGTLSTQTYNSKNIATNRRNGGSAYTEESGDMDLSCISESSSAVIPDECDALAFKPGQKKDSPITEEAGNAGKKETRTDSISKLQIPDSMNNSTSMKSGRSRTSKSGKKRTPSKSQFEYKAARTDEESCLFKFGQSDKKGPNGVRSWVRFPPESNFCL